MASTSKLTFFFASAIFFVLNAARIEDLTDVKGSRSNQLYGYGIVTGLAGQGILELSIPN